MITITPTPIISDNLYNPSNYGVSSIDSVTNQPIERIVSDDHIEVYTTPDFQNFTSSAGKSISIPLFFKYVSSNSSATSTTIIIDPESPSALCCFVSLGPNKGSIRINDYITYDHHGSVLLKKDEVVKIIMTINIPKGLWTYERPRQIPFNLYGVDNIVPIYLSFRGELDA